MATKKSQSAVPPHKPNLISHRAHCSVCAHPECDEIERELISWKSIADIVAEYKLRDRSAVYRHINALGLKTKRYRNIRGGLGRIIERGYNAPVTTTNVIQAYALLARLNAGGELEERDGQPGKEDLLARMNYAEHEAYAKDGTLPSWFPQWKALEYPRSSGGDENA